MRETFTEKRFAKSSLELIEHANSIIAEYQADGFTLTLRQLYYQFVSRDLLANTQREYKRLGGIINDARLAGLIDWLAIEDRTRNLRELDSWESPSELLFKAADWYRIDPWKRQAYRVECWIEKDALVGVIENVCNEFGVPYFACRGYNSQSEQWRAAKRFENYAADGQKVVVLHLGDHDPSGIDMTRDNNDRLAMLSRHSDIEVKRLALNMDQVEKYGPPPNPSKESDSRSRSYIAQFGRKSWELDALEPRVIERLIRREIKKLIDRDPWNEDGDEEAADKARLADLAENWS